MPSLRSFLFAATSIVIWLPGFSAPGFAYPPETEQAPPLPPTADPTSLSVRRIFQSSDFQSKSSSLRWDDTRDVLWKRKTGKEGPALIEVAVPDLTETTIMPRRRFLLPAELLASEKQNQPKPIEISDWQLSTDGRYLLVFNNTKRVWRQNTRGDYWLLDRNDEASQWRKIGGNDAKESSTMFATFSPDGKAVAFVRDNDLYLESCETGDVQIIAASDKDNLIHGTFDWVYEEELSLRNGFRFSPEGDRIAYWQLDDSGVPLQTLIDNTSERYAQIKQFAYPKIGETNSSARVGIWDAATKQTVWLDLPGDPRQHYIAAVDWLPSEFAGANERLLIQQLNRKQNLNRLFLCDATSGQCVCVHTESSDGWVKHQPNLHWMPAKAFGETGPPKLLWMSERSDWMHIDALSLPIIPTIAADTTATASVTAITAGDWDVISIDAVCHDIPRIDFTGAMDTPSQRALYRVEFDGQLPVNNPSRISPNEGGTFTYSISPSCDYALESWSDFNTPSITRLVRLSPYERIETITDNKKLRQTLDELTPMKSQFVRLETEGDVTLDAWIMMPAGVSDKASVPLLVHVYGEPAGQTVVDRYGSSTYLWHRMLTQRGIAVASIDNRGTNAPRGKAFRQAIYGKIGRLNPSDQAAGTRALLKRFPILDPARVGAWGWSGGGSSTLNLVFQYPQLYSMGIAVAPVPDQLDYDTIYQERYMGLIEDNREGLIAGSPITHAGNLEDPLLIIHGTGDDNVHYASTERLLNRLIAENKSIEMFAYPGRTHSIKEGEGTTLHLRTMMTNFLMRTLK